MAEPDWRGMAVGLALVCLGDPALNGAGAAPPAGTPADSGDAVLGAILCIAEAVAVGALAERPEVLDAAERTWRAVRARPGVEAIVVEASARARYTLDRVLGEPNDG